MNIDCRFIECDGKNVCRFCSYVYKFADASRVCRTCSNAPDLVVIAAEFGLKSVPPGSVDILVSYAIGEPLGTGDWLHIGILRWVGECPDRKCGCQDRINQMNAWGPSGCREHLEEITDWLMEEAGNRGWWKLTTLIPCSRFAIKQLLILPAIRQAEMEQEKSAQGNAL